MHVGVKLQSITSISLFHTSLPPVTQKYLLYFSLFFSLLVSNYLCSLHAHYYSLKTF